MLDTNSTTKATSQSILHQSVQYLKGVGPTRTEIFGRLGVHTIYDMLYYFRRDYNDRQFFVVDETGTIAATWFNLPFISNKFHIGDNIFLHWKVGTFNYLQLL